MKDGPLDRDPATHASSFIPHPSLEVSAALLFRGGRLLITQRRRQDHLGGLWEFPGGKREPGESFEDCLRRELVEELGVEVRVGELVGSITHDYAEKSVHLRFFRCALVLADAEPRAIGCDAVEWVGPDELGRFEFPAADARLLDRLRASPSLWADRPA